MPNKRPYISYFDGTLDIPIQQQGDNPAGLEFIPTIATNKRTIVGADGNTYNVSDQAVNPRGSKAVIWSSEGYTYNGVSVPALTVNQKKATGSVATNTALATQPGGAALPAGFTFPTTLDFSPYRDLTLMINLSAITGTSIQFELDYLDDSGTPVSLPIWKPAALTATGSLLVTAGVGNAFPQAAAAPTAPMTGFGAVAVAAGWTYYSLPFSFPPNGTFAWTNVATTVCTWTAWLYGSF